MAQRNKVSVLAKRLVRERQIYQGRTTLISDFVISDFVDSFNKKFKFKQKIERFEQVSPVFLQSYLREHRKMINCILVVRYLEWTKKK